MMTITPRSAHSQSRVPAPDAGDGEPLTVGVGAALVGVAVTVGGVVAGVVAGLVAVTDGWTVVGAAVGLLGATLALLSGDVPTPPDGDSLPLMPLACAQPAAMLAAARSAVSRRSAPATAAQMYSSSPSPPRKRPRSRTSRQPPAAAWIGSWEGRPIGGGREDRRPLFAERLGG